MKGTVNIHIAKLWLIPAALIMLMLGSCRNDSDDRNLETNKVTLHPAIGRSVDNVILTRSVNVEEHRTDDEGMPYSVSSTYPDLEVNGTSMRVYAVPANPALSTAERNSFKSAGSFRYSNDAWHSSVAATINQEYYLYAISPINLPGATDQTFNWGVTDDEFDAGNVVLTFTGLDIITTSDPMVSIAAKGKHVVKEADVYKEVVTEKDNEHPAVTQALTEPTLVKGDYNIGTVYDDGESGDDTYRIWMAMDRLYAKATISFAIDPEYNNLRTIRVKEVNITTKYNGVAQLSHLDGTHSYKFKQGTDFLEGGRLTLSNTGFTATNVTPIDLMTENYDPIDPDDPTAGHYDYATLKVPVSAEQYWEFGSFYFLPQASLPTGLTLPPIYLDVKYDVYSKEGTKVRADQHVVNTLSLNSVYRDDFTDHTPAAGDNVRIKVMVKPTYLYQLSDDDVRFELTIE